MRKICLLTFGIVLLQSGFAQHQQPDAAGIQHKLRKLDVLASVLYVAAHPDDENTRAITFMANDRLAAAAYLSMTRGDGGQNLIGPEFRDQLGLIRTRELLSARKIDGGEQYFTRANDFGYSKNVNETFAIWGKDAILSDVVRVMRQFQPDVILTRFPPNERAGHGQHTASAVLAEEAFELTNRGDYEPDQVKELGTWQAKRLLLNTSPFFDQSINENTPGIVTVNMGTYNPLLGKSYSEIAAESRSQHKSQGFGSAGRRGDTQEFFVLTKGEKPDKDLFSGINTTWSRLPGGDKVQPLVSKAILEFNPLKPEASIPALLLIRTEIIKLSPSVWKARKLKDVNQLIQDCAGLLIEVAADRPWIPPGESVSATIEILNRSSANIRLLSIKNSSLSVDTAMSLDLSRNKLSSFKSRKTLSPSTGYSDPYWLRSDHTLGLFNVPNPSWIGKPENGQAVVFDFEFSFDAEKLTIPVPMIYKWVDPVKGEVNRPIEIVPPVLINLSQKVIVFPDGTARTISALVKSNSSSKLSGPVRLVLPPGWTSEPAAVNVELTGRGEERKVDFRITPGSAEGSFSMTAQMDVNGKTYDQAVQTIVYDHIPFQTLLPKSKSALVRVEIKKEGKMIGYIAGAGDGIPDALRNMGYEVWAMKNDEVIPANLQKLDAVVLGVRALNTNERLRFFMDDLLNYVKGGGTLIVQYNTNFDLEIDKEKFSPFSLNLSRDRVAEEGSEVRILRPDHTALNYPNKIKEQDFSGWVQERGLYFPDKWDANFEALLSMNDTGEKPKDGSLLIARYGSGYYVYTGLSFFRELPEGVSGAYKLFANLVSLGKPVKSTPQPKVRRGGNSQKLKASK